MFAWLMLIAGLVIILIGCDVFTNSIEWLGKKLDLNEGLLGSIFAAVGTALPETLIPIVAVVFGAAAGQSHANDVGLGAIVGAPFMLSTVAMLVTGLAVFIFAMRGRRRDTRLRINRRILARDIRFFLIAFCVALASGFISSQLAKVLIALGLLSFYAFYVFKHATDVAEPHAQEEEADEISPLHFSRLRNAQVGTRNARRRSLNAAPNTPHSELPTPPSELPNPHSALPTPHSDDPSLPIVILQLVVGVGMIIGAATLFVQYVSDVASSLGVTPLILSLIVVPLATELPEKFNSVLWVRRSKDTLALGNITGAMVFQSTLPVSFGMVFTEWQANANYSAAFAQAALAIVAAAVLFAFMVLRRRLTAGALVMSGIWYIAWLLLVFGLDLPQFVRNLGLT